MTSARIVVHQDKVPTLESTKINSRIRNSTVGWWARGYSLVFRVRVHAKTPFFALGPKVYYKELPKVFGSGAGGLRHPKGEVTLKFASVVTSVLTVTSLAVVLTVLMHASVPVVSPVVGFSTSSASLTIKIADSKWIINPGGTFTVYVSVVNNENISIENVDVYAYVFDGSDILNVGGWQSNKVTISLAPNGNENLALGITMKDSVAPGVYSLRSRARLSDNTTYDDTKDIYVENTGIHLKIGPVFRVNFAGSGVFVSATAANLTTDNLDVGVFSHIYCGEQVVSENGWDGNMQENSLSAGEIRNFYFSFKILENTGSGDYILRTRLKLPDNSLVDDNVSVRIVSLAGIKRKLDVLDNGIMAQTENFLDLYYVGRGRDNLIKLNEVYANVAGTDAGNEWVEIYNTSQDNLGWAGFRIAQWKIVNNADTLATVPLGTIIQPDGYYVFEGLSGLNNAGDNVWLINDRGEVIDHLEYASTIEGKSIARVPNASDNWVNNAQLTKGNNNNDNSPGMAYLPKIDLVGIKTVAHRLRQLLVENTENLVVSNAEIYDALGYIDQHGSGISQQDIEQVVRYIQTYGKFPDNYRQELLNGGLTENDVLEIENLAKENSGIITNGAPSLGLGYLRDEFTATIQAFIDTAAANLHIEAAADIEHQLQNPGLSGEQYVAELGNNWNATSSDLAEAGACDNSLYNALKAKNWQTAYGNANAMMSFAENRALEIVDEIRLARSARVYFRENGTFDNIDLVADYELKFTKALDRFLYYYQKGLYFKMAMLAALNGDNEQALSEATNAQNMPLTVDVSPLVWQSLNDAPGTANMAAEVAQSNGNWYVYVARLYQHYLNRYNIGTEQWTTTSVLSENAWGWDAGVSLSYAENGGVGYIYALMGGDTREFWRYNLSNDSWDNLGFTPNFVSTGGSVVWTGGNVLYATRGKSSTEFWLYHIENNTWDNACLAPAPAALESGAGLAWAGGNYLYTFKGGGSATFYRYSISGNSWTSVTTAPAGVGAGASLEWVAPYVWATRGGGMTDFWRYNPSSGNWENRTPTPATVGTRAGDRLAEHEGYLYLARGEFDNQFWRFRLDENWVSVEELLANPSEYDNKEVWIKGFMSNVQRKYTQENVPYSLFDLTTYEGAGAGVDNTRYWLGENADTVISPGDLKLVGNPTSHVVISEVQINSDEFVELYNPTSNSVNMTGWYWSYFPSTRAENNPYRNKQFPSGATIPSHGFYLISVYDDPNTSENYISIANWNIGYAGPQISNTDGAVGIYSANPATKSSPAAAAAVCVDKVGWGSPQVYEGTPAQVPAVGQSLERKARSNSTPASMAPGGADALLGNGYDIGNNSADFIIRVSSQPQNSSTTEQPALVTSGWLESSVYDTGVTVSWENISWIENKPTGTNIVVEIRTGGKSVPDNTWSSWESVTNGQSVDRNSRFIQYKINLLTDNAAITPTLNEIKVEYTMNAQAAEWAQSDWSGGAGMEAWSVQQKLRVYFVPHIDVSQGAKDNSYGVFRGIFHASYWVTGVPQLNMLGVKLFTNGEPVSTDTPACWETYAPWGASGYVGSSSITRGWGWAVYFDEGVKGIREGAIFAAFATLESAFREYTHGFWGDLFGAIWTFVTAAVTVAVGVFCPFAAPFAYIGMSYLGQAIKKGINDWEGSRGASYLEREESWNERMGLKYGWMDHGYEYNGGREGRDDGRDDGRGEGISGCDSGC